MSEVKIKKMTVKQICVIAMLLALTVVLSYLSGYLRIGTFMKFSISFISVYMAAMLYGSLAGGFVGAAADMISCFVIPMGALVWEITVMECFYGILFGLLFYRSRLFVKNIYVRVLLCSVIRLAADLFVKTKILSNYGFAPENYGAALTTRAPGCIAMFVLTFAVMYVSERFYAEKFIKMVKN